MAAARLGTMPRASFIPCSSAPDRPGADSMRWISYSAISSSCTGDESRVQEGWGRAGARSILSEVSAAREPDAALAEPFASTRKSHGETGVHRGLRDDVHSGNSVPGFPERNPRNAVQAGGDWTTRSHAA